MLESPCVRNCCLDQHDCCLGCGRTIDEIMQWHNASELRRAQILFLASERKAALQHNIMAKHPAATPCE